MTAQFTKWSDEVLDVSALPSMVRRAFRVALTPPTGPVFLSLPYDVMTAPTDRDPKELGEIPTAGRGDRRQIERAAGLLVDADNPTMVVGDGVARAGQRAVDAAVELAEACGARVHGEILGCEVDFPASHDQWLSYVPPTEDLAQTLLGTDTLVLVGTSTNTTYTPHEDPLIDTDTTTCIHVGADAWQVGKNQRADAAVVGDPGEVMQELAAAVREVIDPAELDARLDDVAAMKEFVAMKMANLGVDEAPGDPRASKAELVDAMRDVADSHEASVFVVDESVTSKYALLTRWPFEAEGYISNKGGGLGYGLPAAVGAAIAEAEREAEGGEGRRVVGFVGDGSYLYSPQAIYSAVRYDVDLTVVVPDNRNYRILKDNTLALFGGEEADYEFIGTEFEPPVDLVSNAESYGASATRVETPDEIAGAFEDALDAAGPTVLDVLIHD
jgi:benzoylformate decarboxylase